MAADNVYDLSIVECETWMRELGFERENKKPDWDTLRTEAGVKSATAMLKSRWNEGAAPEDRAKIRSVLNDRESKRRARGNGTPSGGRVFAIEAWYDIGTALAEDLPQLEREITRLKPLADQLRKVRDAARRLEAEQAVLQALSSPTPEPKRSRK